MKHKLIISISIICFIGGYLLAVMLFSVTTWVDSGNGDVIVKYRFYPYWVKNTTIETAFYHAYGRFCNNGKHGDLLFVDSMNFSPIQLNASTQGQYLMRAEKNLLLVDRFNNYDTEKRKKIANTFFEILNTKGVMKAYKYSEDLLYSDRISED